MIAFVGAIAAGATGAFFSDTETSTGNTFTAGRLDLKIDSDCHYYQNGIDIGCGEGQDPDGTGPLAPVGIGSWAETDLKDGVHKFFWFNDIKPGDWGEDTISIHVHDNDAWGKMVLRLKNNADNDCTEPEGEAEKKGHDNSGCDAAGELYQKMNFETWLDQGWIPGFQCNNPDDDSTRGPRCPKDPYEGDNIWQQGETPLPLPNPDNPNGPPVTALVHEPMIPTEIIAMDLREGNQVTLPSGTPPSDPALIDSFFDVFFDIGKAAMSQTVASTTLTGPIPAPCALDDGHHEYGLCHGIAKDGRLVGSVTYYIGWKWILPGTVGNEVQSDSLMGDMTFTAEQHRNNPPPPPAP